MDEEKGGDRTLQFFMFSIKSNYTRKNKMMLNI